MSHYFNSSFLFLDLFSQSLGRFVAFAISENMFRRDKKKFEFSGNLKRILCLLFLTQILILIFIEFLFSSVEFVIARLP